MKRYINQDKECILKTFLDFELCNIKHYHICGMGGGGEGGFNPKCFNAYVISTFAKTCVGEKLRGVSPYNPSLRLHPSFFIERNYN